VTSLSDINIPNTTFEATTTNDILLHFTVDGADQLQSLSLDNIAIYSQAKQPNDFSALRLIWDADGNTTSGSTTLGNFTPDSTGLHWTLTLSSPAPVSAGDHLFVATDIQGPASILGGQRVVHLSIPVSGAVFTSGGSLPASPLSGLSNLYLTSEIPPVLYNTTLTDTMPTTIGVGQTGVPVFQLDFTSDSSAAHLYDAGIFLKNVKLSFFDGATQINPAAAISAMSVSSPGDGTEYFNSSSISSYVQGGVTLSIPLTELYSDGPSFSPSYPNSLIFKVDLLPSVSLSSFRIVAESANDIVGQDSYTGRSIPAVGAFPLQSSTAFFQHAATSVSVSFTASGATTQVSKGSSGNSAFQVVLNNPGAANTGIAQLNKLAFTLTDGSGNAVIPNSALRWIRVDDGHFTYLSRSVAESTGNTVFCNNLLLPVNLAASNPITLFIRYDVLAGALPYNIQFHAPVSLLDWGVNQAGSSIAVSMGANLPFDSPTIPIVALFQVSHTSRIPSLVVKGQRNVPFLDLSLNHPGPAPVGPIAIKSLTFHLQDHSGVAVEAFNALQNPRLQIGDTTPDQTFAFSGNKVTITFSSGITLNSSSPDNTAVLSFFSDISSTCPSSSLELRLESSNDFASTQPAEPNRVVFAQAVGDTYPMTSGSIPLQAIDLKSSFTNFPNPFQPETGATRFTYWLTQNSTVNLRIFSLTGLPVRKLITGESRNTGLNTLETWDGRNDSGRMVLNGIYLAVLEVNASGTKSTVKRFVAVVK
jgi:hypothetical protein